MARLGVPGHRIHGRSRGCPSHPTDHQSRNSKWVVLISAPSGVRVAAGLSFPSCFPARASVVCELVTFVVAWTLADLADRTEPGRDELAADDVLRAVRFRWNRCRAK